MVFGLGVWVGMGGGDGWTEERVKGKEGEKGKGEERRGTSLFSEEELVDDDSVRVDLI